MRIMMSVKKSKTDSHMWATSEDMKGETEGRYMRLLCVKSRDV